MRAWVAVHEKAAACGKSTRNTRRRVARGLLALGVAATGFTAATPGASSYASGGGARQLCTNGITCSICTRRTVRFRNSKYKVLFDQDRLARTFPWKPASCADALGQADGS
nr:hypothetical protein [Burkholderia anthina]